MDELNIKLIDLVESEPCIYDKTDVFYSNKDHVKQVWEKISNEIQLSVPVCQKRWRYLRDYFVRQLHMSKTDNKKSYWSLFERMLFLAPFSTRKVRINTLISELCTTSTPTNAVSKKKRQRSTSAITKKNWENDQNSNILSVSSSNSNAGIDEFNSLDYLNLYQAQFGFADNAALLQLQKQTNFSSNLDDRIPILPLEIQIRSPSSEFNNSAINIAKQVSTTESTTAITTSTPISSQNLQNLIGYNLVSTSTAKNEISSNSDSRLQNQFSRNINQMQSNDLNCRISDFQSNYQNSALLAVESHYSNSEKSPITTQQQNDDEKFQHRRFNTIDGRNRLSSCIIDGVTEVIETEAEDLRKRKLKNNSSKINSKTKHSIKIKKSKKTEILSELLEILRKSENISGDEHDYFFRSLLNSVRRIDEHLIIPFRAEILKTVMKFREMSNNNNNNTNIMNQIPQDEQTNCNINNNTFCINNQQNNLNFNSRDYDDSEDVVIIDTGESNWRQKLKRY